MSIRSLVAISCATCLTAAALHAQTARPWLGHGRDPFHNAISTVPSQTLTRIRWSTPVDLMPQYSGTALLIHYGSPLVTRVGTVIVPVKTGVSGDFQIEGRNPADGSLLWTQTTDFVLTPHNWVPSIGPTLTVQNRLAVPAAGGTIDLRENADDPSSTVKKLAFYGLEAYRANPAVFDANVRICTPITADDAGNLFFGFVVLGPTPNGLRAGIARVSSTGKGTWISATNAAQDRTVHQVVTNCAPALSLDGKTLYIAVSGGFDLFGNGDLIQIDAQTLGPVSKVRLKDAHYPDNDAYLPDDGSGAPTVGPDGDVYFGVLEGPFGTNNFRGWMKHYDSTLTQEKLPGAFGWDDTASIVPASMVPSYTGPSSYLLLTKYNNYAGAGTGTGENKMAIVDPNTPMVDSISGATVMNEVLTVLGPTPDPEYTAFYPNAVREWCINTAAIDPAKKSAYVNNEDGKLYRWDLTTNTLSETMVLTAGIGEAYTPTIIGMDGTVYAINNAQLFAVGN